MTGKPAIKYCDHNYSYHIYTIYKLNGFVMRLQCREARDDDDEIAGKPNVY